MDRVASRRALRSGTERRGDSGRRPGGPRREAFCARLVTAARGALMSQRATPLRLRGREDSDSDSDDLFH